ncbi:dermonecrotic toxin domain-containing protein [Pseudomonas sp. NPDC085632]|uniref:dermonecrotic toxin domain-containing protein n=1 Tax=Pseudomonas sp. NPDC085632 TaxID=3364429 RepID=UPI0037C799A5
MDTPLKKQPVAATVNLQSDPLDRFNHLFKKNDPKKLTDFRNAINQATPFHHYFESLVSKLVNLEQYCRLKLLHALKQKYGMRFSVDDLIRLAPANTKDQTSPTLTLLQAAMLNFTDEEATAGYFSNDSGTLPQPRKTSEPGSSDLRISAEEFAALSRELDLGGAYLKYISSVLKDARVTRLGAQLHRHNFELCAYEKYFTKPPGKDALGAEFPPHQLHALMQLVYSKEDILTGDLFYNGKIQLHALQLFGKYTTDATLITWRHSTEAKKDSFILYVPNDSGDGFYTSNNRIEYIDRFVYEFLPKAEFRELIKSQLPITEQHDFALNTLENIHSDINFIPLGKGLNQHLFDRYVDKLFADSREFAVPVVNINEAAYANRRKKSALGKYFTSLKSPTDDFITRLRTHPTDRLLSSVFNSVNTWPVPERHLALIRLLDLKKIPSAADGDSNGNKPQADEGAATDYFDQFELTEKSTGHPLYLQKKSAVSEYEVKAYIASLVIAQGSLDHYEHKIYEWNDRHFIKVADSVFEVEPDPLAWRVCHPLDPYAYRPPAVYSPTKGWSVKHGVGIKQSTHAQENIDHKAVVSCGPETDPTPRL